MAPWRLAYKKIGDSCSSVRTVRWVILSHGGNTRKPWLETPSNFSTFFGDFHPGTREGRAPLAVAPALVAVQPRMVAWERAENGGFVGAQEELCWLVVGPPLWKIWTSIRMIRNLIYGKIKNGNQTTNQFGNFWCAEHLCRGPGPPGKSSHTGLKAGLPKQ